MGPQRSDWRRSSALFQLAKLPAGRVVGKMNMASIPSFHAGPHDASAAASEDYQLLAAGSGLSMPAVEPQELPRRPVLLWEPSVVGIGDNFKQLLKTFVPDRCDDPEFRQVRTSDRVTWSAEQDRRGGPDADKCPS